MKLKRIFAIGGGAIVGIGVAVFLWIWWGPCALGGCAPLDDLAEYQAEGSELLDVNGDPFARLATVNRQIVTLDSLPAHLPQAFVAIEDRRFYDHGGVDFFRTVGALVSNLKAGQVSEGGSTITQQLARNLFPEWLPYTQRNVRRKIMEARVARQIERTFPKDKILELYINHIYLGNGAYGVEAAAQTYFAKSAADLTIMEAATIAGIPQSPSQGNPINDLERSTNRRNLVLDQMVEAGYIDAATGAAAQEEPIVVAEGLPAEGPASSYFVERVRMELEEQVGTRFYTAGLKIHTTLDPAVQQITEEELYRQMGAIESGGFGTYRHPTYANTVAEDGTDYLQGAAVVIDVLTGEVRALVGGRDFADSKFDRATQALRQAGSAFKPFIFATGLERYRTPAHQLDDAPISIPISGSQVWEPRNYNGVYDGLITMREALTRSKNAATVMLTQQVGLRPAINLAHGLGINSDIPDVPATALGAADVRPMELIAAYAAFANGGNRIEPHLIRQVVDRDGRVLWEARPQRRQAMDPGIAYVLTSMLRDVVDRGTGSAVRAVGFTGPAAGKTGTTNDASDVWFIGYTPELVAGVWMGLDRPQTIVRGASGGTLAAPVWGRMMRRIYADRPMPEEWTAPPSVTTAEVDRMTGAAIDENCPAQGPVLTEYFVGSSPPSQYCPVYSYDSLYPPGDTGWIDEEWGDYDYDYDYDYDPLADPAAIQGGIDWPELEALRRRVRQRGGMYDSIMGPGGTPPAGGLPPVGEIVPSSPRGGVQPGAAPLPGGPSQPGAIPQPGGSPQPGASPQPGGPSQPAVTPQPGAPAQPGDASPSAPAGEPAAPSTPAPGTPLPTPRGLNGNNPPPTPAPAPENAEPAQPSEDEQPDPSPAPGAEGGGASGQPSSFEAIPP